MKLKLFSSPIWRGAALIERLNFQSSRRYAHTNILACRMQNEAAAQIRLRDTKNTDKRKRWVL